MAAIGSTYKVISLDNIFFNEIAMLDVNIFNFSAAAGSEIGSRNVLYEIRENVAVQVQPTREAMRKIIPLSSLRKSKMLIRSE